MNIYDKKIVKCTSCKRSIGEIDYDAEVIYPQCVHCVDPKPYDSSDDFNITTKHNLPNVSIISQIGK